MRFKKIITVCCAGLLAVAVCAANAEQRMMSGHGMMGKSMMGGQPHEMMEKACPMAQKSKEMKGQKKKGLQEKFMKKIRFIYKNEEELGITEKQMKELKGVKLETKKALIIKEAEIEVLELDIKALLWDDPVDVTAIEAMIDQKYDIKKQKAKILVGAYARLKKILTDKQKDTMKTLWKKGKKK